LVIHVQLIQIPCLKLGHTGITGQSMTSGELVELKSFLGQLLAVSLRLPHYSHQEIVKVNRALKTRVK